MQLKKWKISAAILAAAIVIFSIAVEGDGVIIALVKGVLFTGLVMFGSKSFIEEKKK